MRRSKGIGSAYWGVLVLAIVLSSLVTYSYVIGARSGSTSSSSQQALIRALQSQVEELNKELGAKTPPANMSLFGLNPVQIYQNDSAGIVTVQGAQTSGGITSTVLGAGFVYDFLGTDYIVTNYHVVQGVSDITVTFQDGDAYQATLVGSDGYSDLAVLNVTAPLEFHPLRVVTSSTLVVGQPVLAIGNPFGLSGSMTFGIVSQLGRTITESLAGNFAIANVIQFSAPINPGNSGGVLLDVQGAVVGITTATVESSQGVGFAIPSDTILVELPSLIETGSYNLHPLMGIGVVDMNLQLAKLQNTNVTYGALIENITRGGPADRAGLVAGSHTAVVQGSTYYIGGDIIVAIDGTKIVNTDALSSYLAEHALAGQTLSLQIVRTGHYETIQIVLGTRPPVPSA